MHLTLILVALAVAVWVRLGWANVEANVGAGAAAPWRARWQQTLGRFLFPPLLFGVTAIAVLSMGTQGQMMGLSVGWWGYLLAAAFLTTALLQLGWLAWQGWRSLHQLRTYPTLSQNDATARLLDTPSLFAAQIGFWQPQLVVSRGLLAKLTADQLRAVLTHEQAHLHYRDTFWFFWLGWLRHLTAWLPHTEALWQELLLLRELRADQWAAQRVDPLLVAESLLLVVQSSLTEPDFACSVASANFHLDRLEERIDALLDPEPPQPTAQTWWLLLAFLPLLTLLLHR